MAKRRNSPKVNASVDDGFIINLSNWMRSDYQAYQVSASSEMFEECVPYILQVVTAWPFEAEVSEDGIAEVNFLQTLQIFGAINRAIQDAFSEGN